MVLVTTCSSCTTVGSNMIVGMDVTNSGTMAHDLKLKGLTGTKMLLPGRRETVSVGVIGEVGDLGQDLVVHELGQVLVAC